MNMTCKIAMDLAELYKAGIVSKESAEAIRSHLHSCEACRRYYRECETAVRHRFLVDGALSESDVYNAEARSYAALSRKLRRRRLLQIVCTGAVIGAGTVMLATGVILMRKGNSLQWD